MGLQPKINGKTVERAYEDYRNGIYLVNRRYQRKLVWNRNEKEAFIDSMNYPAASCGVSKVATSTYNPICYTALFSLRFYRLFYNFFPVPVLSHIYL